MKQLYHKLRQLLTAHISAAGAARYWLRRLGWPGALAAGLFAVSPAFYLSAIRPAQAVLEQAQHSAAQGHAEAAAKGSFSGQQLGTQAQLAEFYRKFPPESHSPEALQTLMQLAQDRGLSLNDGEYAATREKVGRLVRYQMSLRVHGSYPQIRQFLTDLPGALPVVALENVQFERQKIADPDVDAKLRLVLYLEQAS